jgi:uncharacterized protein
LRTLDSVIEVGADHGKVAVVSDTHSRPHPRTYELVERVRPKHIFHAGDVGDRRVLDELAAIAPVSAIRGNVDGRSPDLPDIRRLHVMSAGRELLVIVLLHVGIARIKLRADAAAVARAAGASLLVCGHTHIPFIGRDRGLTIFNPGACGPRRFHLPVVFGLIELTPERVRLEHVDCETGARWLPP